MKKKPTIFVLSILFVMCLPGFVSAAPNIVGTWKNTSVRKVTAAACSAPIAVTVTLTQCLVGTTPGNLFKGTVTVGTGAPVSIVGRINPDNSFSAHGQTTVAPIPTIVSLSGKYLPATATLPVRLEVSEFSYFIAATSQLNEVYDIFTLQK